MLELHEASADGSDVALLIGESHSAGTLGILQLRVRVDASIAHPTVQTIHDHGQLDWKEDKQSV